MFKGVREPLHPQTDRLTPLVDLSIHPIIPSVVYKNTNPSRIAQVLTFLAMQETYPIIFSLLSLQILPYIFHLLPIIR